MYNLIPWVRPQTWRVCLSLRPFFPAICTITSLIRGVSHFKVESEWSRLKIKFCDSYYTQTIPKL